MPSEQQNKIAREMEGALAVLRERSQLRSFSQLPGANFCSNDYLGLAEDDSLKRAVLEAVEKSSRVGGTGSRLLSGHDRVWSELEEEFADFACTEAALYFSSGYAANVGLLTAVLGKGDVVFSDALNHASLIDGMRLSGARRVIYPHLDLNMLEEELRARRHETCRKMIVTESVFSMDGDIADLRSIQKLAERYGAAVIVDEAHATAVHGPGGAGMVAEAGRADEILAVVHTCGKALASAGGFVCGSKLLRDYLVNHARTLIFSTAMPPYMAGQIRAALNIAKQMNWQRESLLCKARRFALALCSDGWKVPGTDSQIIPVIVGGNDQALAAAQFLQRKGFAIRAIRPPTVPVGSARLRLSLTASITEDDLERLRESIRALEMPEFVRAAGGTGAAHA
jgi:8-amino-7-oxononanoate synthase